MFWRQIHRWLGLVAGTVALVLGLTGAVLSLDPVLSRWQAQPTPAGLTVAQLADRVAANTPGAEEIRRLPSGEVVVYAFDNGQARANRIDPASGQLALLQRVASGGVSPWGFAIHGSGRWMLVAHQRSETVNVFRIDPATGLLQDTGQSLATPSPVSLTFVP